MTSLNTEQQAALNAIKAGQNIFLTGAGGTGKSHTIRAIVGWARDAGLAYAVTAMTGCAALLLNTSGITGAKTLHSWAGVGLAREAPHELAAAVARNKTAMRRWRDTQLLIVDEVSMMTPEFLDKLDCVARRVRRRDGDRFGGIQIVLSGDFCQLPPVTKDVSGGAAAGPKFLFESPHWPTLIDRTITLHQIRRQTDPVFQQLLTEARMGRLSMESIGILETRKDLPWQENEIRPTLLFTRNAEVDAINRKNMEALTGEEQIYTAQTVVVDNTAAARRSGGPGAPTTKPTRLASPTDPDVITALDRLDSDAPYEPTLQLRVGAQVMLLTNMDQERGLVNGSRGVVLRYTPGGLPVVKFLSCEDTVVVDRATWWLADDSGIGRAQIPLKVAYAITIHKSQGATLDSALVDIGSSTFEFGQAYVALSRVRALDGLYVWKMDPRKIRAHPAVVDFYDRIGPAAVDPGLTTTETQAPTAEEEPTDDDPAPPASWTTDGLSPAWNAIIGPYMTSRAGIRLREQVTARAAIQPIAPQPEDVFAALRACPDPATVRVVILGQDPYHTPGMAHGLAFSVRPTVGKLPPSLQNIFKELTSDLELPPESKPTNGCLTRWSSQGVLLLNDILTVTLGAALSHAGLGWEELTAQLLAAVLQAAPHVVVIAWGNPAQKKLDHPAVRPLLAKHTVLKAVHPSPLSAHRGFFGSRPFSAANAALVAHGQAPIEWI
jgi:ATP-dependent DNA helicase PIF1